GLLYAFRPPVGLQADSVVEQIRSFPRDKLLPGLRKVATEPDIPFEPLYEYPGLDVAPEHPAVTFVKRLVDRNDHSKVAYGTEAGLFQNGAGVASIVCGPGSIEQAHRPDEFLDLSQVEL